MRKFFALVFLGISVWTGSVVLGAPREVSGIAQLLVLAYGVFSAFALLVAALLAFGPRHTERRHRTASPLGQAFASVALAGIGLLIVVVTLQGLFAGALRPLVSSASRVHWHATPVRFVLEAAAWMVLAALLGWFLPRFLRSSPQDAEPPASDGSP